MASRISISYAVPDARAFVKERQFQGIAGNNKIKKVSIVDSYVIDTTLTDRQIRLAANFLTNSTIENYTINKVKAPHKFNWLIEVGYLPGVTDNVGATAKETIEDILKKKFKKNEAVYTSQIYFITGQLTKADIQQIAYSLHNPLIQRVRVKSRKGFEQERGLPIVIPNVKLTAKQAVITVNLQVEDDELVKIGKQGILDPDGTRRGPLALDLEYLRAIRDYFKSKKRNPTDIELESIAQTWSEHCKHTIFANPLDEIKGGLYKSYIKEATRVIREKKGKRDFCVSVFTDNSGGIVFDENYIVSHKVETHNSPSALDPFGGSITGIVGVNRDTIGFGMGAKPIANVYGFCLADPKDTRVLYRDKTLTQKMLLPRRIMDGVIQGVNVGGNCSGIPTVHGFVHFNDRFRGKPLVFVGTIGLLPKKVCRKDSTKKRAEPGDYIVMIGGRVGQDGIHGATFSSESMDSGSPATAVQIGDPITQKKLSDAIVKEARDAELYHSITDNGAGGLSCSVAEMAKECNGCHVDLEEVPLKYPGLEPWKIWISESQERMTLAVPKNKWKKFSQLMQDRGVEATVIGTFNKSGKCTVTYKKKTILDIDLDFLHDGLPKKQLVSSEATLLHNELPSQKTKDLTPVMSEMLKRLNTTSYEFISSQYDHEVQANSVIKPLQGRGRVNGDAAVIRPILDSERGVVLSSVLNPTYSELDSYKMAGACIDGAIRSAVAAGATIDTLALLDNFCWCSSNDPIRLGQLKQAVKACYDYSVLYGTPLISGKDSMFNDFKGFDAKGNPVLISIPPTLLVSSIGVINDVRKAHSIDFKFDGDLIYLLGDTYEELGGSEYMRYLGERDKEEYTGTVPEVRGEKNKKMYQTFAKLTDSGLLTSAISVGRGGLALALLKSSMAGMLGIDISLQQVSKYSPSDDAVLFSESQGRILVSVSSAYKKQFETMTKGVPTYRLGNVRGDKQISIRGRGDTRVVKTSVTDALKAYKSTFKNF